MEEAQRQAEREYLENLRNDLYMEEYEEAERRKTKDAKDKKESIRQELLLAEEY
jgi:hypothetical protein